MFDRLTWTFMRESGHSIAHTISAYLQPPQDSAEHLGAEKGVSQSKITRCWVCNGTNVSSAASVPSGNNHRV